MKRCNNRKVNQAPTIKPKWYTRLIPNRKTLDKWAKRLVKTFKVQIDISLGDAFKWIFCILVWNTFFPTSIPQFVTVLKLALPFL